MKTITLALIFLATPQIFTSQTTDLTKLDLTGQFKAKIDYREVMTVETMKVERKPVGFDPDVTPHEFYCQTTVIANVGDLSVTGKVENTVLEQNAIAIKALITIDSADDGVCKTSAFKTDTWYRVSLSAYHAPLTFKGRKNFKEYILTTTTAFNSGNIIFTQAENGAPVVRGFDFNTGNESKRLNEMKMSWTAYYKAGSDPRVILQEQGELPLSE